jgi:hypothetical protein
VLKTFEPVVQDAARATADEAGDDEEGEAAGKAAGSVGGRAKRPRDHCGAGGGAGGAKDEEEERAEEREAGGDEAFSHGQSVLAELARAQASLAVLEARSLAAAAVVLARVDAEAALLPAQRRVATLAAMAAATQRYKKDKKEGTTAAGDANLPSFYARALCMHARVCVCDARIRIAKLLSSVGPQLGGPSLLSCGVAPPPTRVRRYASLAEEATASLVAQRLRAEEDMEANCAVCLKGEVFVGQQIVFCEYCNVAVHQQVGKSRPFPWPRHDPCAGFAAKTFLFTHFFLKNSFFLCEALV